MTTRFRLMPKRLMQAILLVGLLGLLVSPGGAMAEGVLMLVDHGITESTPSSTGRSKVDSWASMRYDGSLGADLGRQATVGTGVKERDTGWTYTNTGYQSSVSTTLHSTGQRIDCPTSCGGEVTIDVCKGANLPTQLEQKSEASIIRSGTYGNFEGSWTAYHQSSYCTYDPDTGGSGGDGPMEDDTGDTTPNWWVVLGSTPIVLDLEGDNFRFTSLEGGVFFDLNHDGTPDWVSWTAPTSDDAFLVLDRNGNGMIDGGRELFGSFTPQPESTEPNGYAALQVYDRVEAGGNGDGLISEADAIFADLQLWRDADQNGVSQPSELRPLASSGITALDLDYVVSNRRDRHGNVLRWAGMVREGESRRLGAADVLFLVDP